MRNAHARVALLTFVLASTSCSWRNARPHALLRLRMALAPAVVPADHPIAVDGAAPVFAHPRADANDHDLGERFAARPLPMPAVHVGQTRRFQFDGFRRGWVAQFDHAALLQTPAFANGKVFVGAGFHSTTVYALDAENGDLRWVGETPDGGPTAAIVDDDKVLFNTESCTLFAFDARNGRSLWSHYLGDPLMSQPAASHGLVYSAYPDSSAPNGFSFAAMSMRNGDFVWRIPIRADVLTAPVIDGAAVYFTTMNGVAYRVDANSGRVRWMRAVSATSAPSVQEGVVYLSQRAPHAAERQIVLDANDGHTVANGDAVNAPYAAIRPDTGGTESGWRYEGARPTYADGRLYYAMGHDLVARDATTGREVWRRNYPASIAARGMTSPSVIGGQLVVGTHDGKLFGLDIDTGSTTWAFDVGEPIAFQPAVANGWVYTATARGKVIGLEVADRSLDGWHMWGGNAVHNGLSAHRVAPTAENRPTEGTLRATRGRDADHAFPLVHTRVSAHVSGFVARVEVEQSFANPFDHPIDAEYLFPLPGDSAVDGMEMHIGDRTIRGDIARREQARARYEAARSCGRRAALLEQQQPDLFRQSVANIRPGETVRVTLQFAETVPYRDGEYEFVFPMATGARDGETARTRPAADVEMHVDVDAGMTLDAIASPSHAVNVVREGDARARIEFASGHAVADRDFLLRYRPHAETAEPAVLAWHDASDAPGMFTFMLHPDTRAATRDARAREVDFVVDTSSSMHGEPLAHAQTLLHRAIDRLGTNDTFRIVRFSDTVSAIESDALATNTITRQRAHAYVAGLVAAGSTDAATGLQSALDAPNDPSRVRIVVLVSDGYLGDDRAVLRMVNERIGRARLFAFGIGSSVNRYLLEQLAELGRGEASAVTPSEDPAIAADRFATLLDRPFLTDVGIDWNGLAVHDVYPRYVPDLYAGRPILVHGRFDHAGAADVRVSGFIGSSPWSRSVHVVLPERARDHEALPSVWARARVRDLSRSLVLGETDALREEIAQLGLAYHLVTAYTSFVAVDESAGDAAQCSGMPVTGGSAYGYGGLGAVGYGYGAGSTNSVGYGVIGTVAHGSGTGDDYRLGERITVSVPMIRAAPPVVMGSLSTPTIRNTVLRNIGQVRMCYQRALQRSPSLEGRVTVRFVIGLDGAIAAAAVADSTITDASVGECIVAAVRAWVFPAPPDGSVITVNYPFTFSAAEPAARPTRFEVPRDL